MRYVSILAAAHIFNCDRLTVYSWIRRGCPVREAGRQGKPAKLDFEAIVRWRRSYSEDQGWSPDGIKLEEKRARERRRALTRERRKS